MARALEKEFPDLEIAGNEGGKYRIGSFEVSLGGKLIHSKLGGSGFPESAGIVAKIRENS